MNGLVFGKVAIENKIGNKAKVGLILINVQALSCFKGLKAENNGDKHGFRQGEIKGGRV